MKYPLIHPESKACLRRLASETAKSRTLAPVSGWCGQWPVAPPTLAIASPFGCLAGVLQEEDAAPAVGPAPLSRPSRPARPATVRREPTASLSAAPRTVPGPLSCPAQAPREQLTALVRTRESVDEPWAEPDSRKPACPAPAALDAASRKRPASQRLTEQLAALPAVVRHAPQRRQSPWPRDREFARRVFPQKCAGQTLETLASFMAPAAGARPASGAAEPALTGAPCAVAWEDLERWSRPLARRSLGSSEAERLTPPVLPTKHELSREPAPLRQTESGLAASPPAKLAAQRSVAAAAAAAGGGAAPPLAEHEPVGFSTTQSAPTPDWSVAVARGASEQLTRVFPPSGTALPPMLMPERMLFPPSSGVTGPGQRLAIAGEEARPPEDDLPGLAEKLHRLLREDARRHGIDV